MGVHDPIAGLIDDLTYRSYRANRESAPLVTPESWKKVYGPQVDEFEQRYQDEANAYANTSIKNAKEVTGSQHRSDLEITVDGRQLRLGK